MQQGLQSFSLGVKGPDIRLRQPLRPCRVKDRPFIASTDLGQGKPEKEQLTQNALSRRSAILLTSISLLSASNFVAKESLASSQGQQLPASKEADHACSTINWLSRTNMAHLTGLRLRVLDFAVQDVFVHAHSYCAKSCSDTYPLS